MTTLNAFLSPTKKLSTVSSIPANSIDEITIGSGSPSSKVASSIIISPLGILTEALLFPTSGL